MGWIALQGTEGKQWTVINSDNIVIIEDTPTQFVKQVWLNSNKPLLVEFLDQDGFNALLDALKDGGGVCVVKNRPTYQYWFQEEI